MVIRVGALEADQVSNYLFCYYRSLCFSLSRIDSSSAYHSCNVQFQIADL